MIILKSYISRINSNYIGKLFSDKPKYFEIQYLNSIDSIIPFLEGHFMTKKGNHVIEIRSSEGAVLKAFTELG
jgi:hypothetical protein